MRDQDKGRSLLMMLGHARMMQLSLAWHTDSTRRSPSGFAADRPDVDLVTHGLREGV